MAIDVGNATDFVSLGGSIIAVASTFYNSTLPNAVLGAAVWLKMRDNQWRLMDLQNAVSDDCLFPINVSPLTTTRLQLAIATRANHEAEDSFAGRDAAGGDALPREVPIRIELTGLNGRNFVHEFIDSGDGLNRTEQHARAA